MKKHLYILCFLTFLWAIGASFAQNIESLDIVREYDQTITIPSQCSPDDIIIVVNSSIPDLKFESNRLGNDDFIVMHLSESNHYIICHKRIKFLLSVSGPNLQSEDIQIFNLTENYFFTITSNVAKGTVKFNTIPDNALVEFPDLNISISSTQPMTNNSGKYKIRIIKAHFKTIDTVITIPRDTATKVYNFTLTPLFAQIKLKIETEDNAAFIAAPLMWIDDRRISLDALIKPEMTDSYANMVEFFKFYKDGFIPLPEGNYQIRIEADNYQPFNTFVHVEDGKIQTVPVMLELIYGYITFIDKLNSEGASVFLNDQPIGEVPIFEAKARVGTNLIRIEKIGFMTEETEYKVQVSEQVNTDFEVSMESSHNITIESEPSSAEILLDGQRIGFTPLSRMMPAGEYSLLLKKSGFSSETFNLKLNAQSKLEDTIKMNLKKNYPLTIISEQERLELAIEGLEDLQSIYIENTNRTPADLMLPYGTYKIKTLDYKKSVTYAGNFNHNGLLQSIVLPSYSSMSFNILTADFIDKSNYEASIGRVHIFPFTGLSTAIINFHYYEFKVEDEIFKTIMVSPFFINWDWRFGGSIQRNIDISALSRWKWTPGVSQFQGNLLGLHDANMWSAFFGGELSSRLPYFNVNIKAGYQYLEGDIKLWSNENKNYQENSVWIPLQKRFIISFGLTVNGPIYKSNNMLRIWKKPFIGPALFL